MTRQLAPIAIFAYRRKDTLEAVVDSLETCPEFSDSPVFIFSDGPKNAGAIKDVEDVRQAIRARLRPNMMLVEAPANKGLARSIIDGMTRLCEEFGRAIVIEDDLIVSPHILEWFNTALDHYADDDRVMQISGHMFDSPSLRTRKSGIFLPFTSSWGWATWKRAWDVMDEKATGWEVLNTDRKLRKRFDIDGVYPYTRMLNMQMRGEIDSWAIRWYWSMFRKNGLALYPPRTLVKNIGTDDRATHGSLRRRIMALFHKPQSISSVRPSMPDEVAIDRRAFSATKRAVLFRRI